MIRGILNMIFICIVFIGNNCKAQTAHKHLVLGDKHYQSGEYLKAEEEYRKSRTKESSLQSHFNLGNSLFKQERFEEAVDQFQFAVQKSQTKDQSSKAYYNLGNAHFYNEKIEDAITAYKNAVLEDPTNEEAQYNLVVCKEILKQKQQEQQNQQCDNPQQSEDQEKSENDSQEEKEQQEQNQEDQSEEEQQESNEETQDSTDDQNITANFDSTRLEKQTLDSLDAMKLLQIIQSEEQKVQEKLRKYNSDRKKQDKDW